MYRQRMHLFPKTQQDFMEMMRLGEEFNKLAADKGWTQGTLWMPTVGGSEVVAEFDYVDLATFQRESESMFQDPEMMAVSGKIWALGAAREPYSELLQTMPSAA